MQAQQYPPHDPFVHDLASSGVVSPSSRFQEQEDHPDPQNQDYTEVFAWGNDMRGQLGINSRAGKSYTLPKLVCFHTVIQEVSCGEDHAALITSQGYLYTMGSNQDGKLGIGSSRILSANVPTLVESLDHAQLISVSCGWTHTVALTSNGQVYSWGLSEQGALGHGKTVERAIYQPVLLGFFSKLNIQIRQVSCGSMHTAFVSGTGDLYTCGNGNEGQLGLGKKSREYVPKEVTRTAEPVEKVACGIFHTCFISCSGQVYGMGGNNFGQLGNGSKKRSLVPVLCKTLQGKRVKNIACGHHSAAVTEDGDLYVWGTGVFGEYLTPQRFSALDQEQQFKFVSIGGTFGAAVSHDGSVWTWGMNTNGELGIGDNEPRLYPVLVQSITHKNVEMVSCGGSFALSTGTVVHDSHPSEQEAASVPSSVKSGAQPSVTQKNISENLKIKIPQQQDKLGVKKNQNRERSFGENIGNTSVVNETSKEGPSFGEDGEGGLNSYVELLKRQKGQLETALHEEKIERYKKEAELKELKSHKEQPWDQNVIKRNKELVKEVDSLKYALVEERQRIAHLEDQNKQLLKSLSEQLKLLEMRGSGENEASGRLKKENEELKKELKSFENTLTQQAKQNFQLEQRIAEQDKKLAQYESNRVSLVSSRIPTKRETDLQESGRKRELYEKPEEVTYSVRNMKPSPEKKVERVDISPRTQKKSEYGTGPSYKERRIAQSSDGLWRPKREEKIIKLTPTQHKETFADVSPEVRKQREGSPNRFESPRLEKKPISRGQSPGQKDHSDIFQSPKKPEFNSPIKSDDIGTSTPVRARSCYQKPPPRQPCGFTKTPEINVISPSSMAQRVNPEKTPKFINRAGSNIEDSITLPERGRQLDSYQQKLLRDLQRSVGSPFSGASAASALKRPDLHSDIRYHIPFDVKLNDNYMDRSAHKLYALTSKYEQWVESPLKTQSPRE